MLLYEGESDTETDADTNADSDSFGYIEVWGRGRRPHGSRQEDWQPVDKKWLYGEGGGQG